MSNLQKDEEMLLPWLSEEQVERCKDGLKGRWRRMTLQETIENICENQIPKEVNGVSTKYVVSLHSLENLGEVVEIAILPTHIKSIDIGVKMRFTHRVFYEKKLEQDIRELLCMYIRNIIGWTDNRVVKEITLEEWVKSEDGNSDGR